MILHPTANAHFAHGQRLFEDTHKKLQEAEEAFKAALVVDQELRNRLM